jgi:hypothetical protein
MHKISHKEQIPWLISKGHHNHPLLRALRYRSRKKQGFPLSDDQQRRVDTLERGLAEHDQVVNYSSESGFYLVPRDPKIDSPDAVVRLPTEPTV